MIKFAAICPHPPIIIPTIGSPSDFKKTVETRKAMEKIAEIFIKKQPKTVILISPHGPVEYREITINISPTLFGNFEQFNDYETRFSFENDLEIAKLLYQESKSQKIPVRLLGQPILDHGSLVPLYYLTKNLKKVKIIPVAYSYPDVKINFDFGKIISDICDNNKEKKIAVIASGDLSHRLTFDAPAGFNPEGAEFDKQLIQSLDNNDTETVLNINKKLIEQAGECGYLSIVTLLGVIEQLNKGRVFKKAKFKSLSYEGPFGVGYLVGYYKL